MHIQQNSIGVFDSGYGGITILKELMMVLPQYNYMYVGDNARAPYGPLDYETVTTYTTQMVDWLFKQGCPLIILACNTASAKSLRTIQQVYLPKHYPNNRVLGIIIPTAEVIGNYTTSKHIGILATQGTVNSDSYPIEIAKSFPDLKVAQEACPNWVTYIENNTVNTTEATADIEKHTKNLFAKDKNIDAVLLGCTHYPLIAYKIKNYVDENVRLITQDEIIAESLEDYLNRHPEMKMRIKQDGQVTYYTTGNVDDFNEHSEKLFGIQPNAKHIDVS